MLIVAKEMDHEQKHLSVNLADGASAHLTLDDTVFFHHEPWIDEGAGRSLKANTMLPQVAGVLLIVPFKAHTSRLYIYVYTALWPNTRKCQPRMHIPGGDEED